MKPAAAKKPKKKALSGAGMPARNPGGLLAQIKQEQTNARTDQRGG
jgi:hypothetical protein